MVRHDVRHSKVPGNKIKIINYIFKNVLKAYGSSTVDFVASKSQNLRQKLAVRGINKSYHKRLRSCDCSHPEIILRFRRYLEEREPKIRLRRYFGS